MSEWGRRLLQGKPEPYYKRSGLVSVATILGPDNEDVMKRFNELLASMDQRGTLPTTRELFPNLTDGDGQRSPVRRHS